MKRKINVKSNNLIRKRKEKDSLGPKYIPEDAIYSIHTARSLENFRISGKRFPLEIIKAITMIKRAAAEANMKQGLLSKRKAYAIMKACDKILSGKNNDAFMIDAFQAGSGTSSHMNVNEVIANMAEEILGGKRGEKRVIHPNDDVNKGQSSNNVIPTAIKLAVVKESLPLIESLRSVEKTLLKKATEFKNILKSGRTHLQDAVPMTLGMEFNAFATSIRKGIKRIEQTRDSLLVLGIGGNAIGTGINTKRGFRKIIISAINKINKSGRYKFKQAEDGIWATNNLTDIAFFSSSLTMIAMDISRMCNDLRLLSSGPNTGINEISLPPVEPGSSIMPGKINPSICESANMACIAIQGNDYSISMASAGSQLQLNTYMPLIGMKIIESIGLLRNTAIVLVEKCLKDIKANKGVCLKHFEESSALAALLNPLIGYEKASEIAKESVKKNKTIKELVIEKGIMNEKAILNIIKESLKAR